MPARPPKRAPKRERTRDPKREKLRAAKGDPPRFAPSAFLKGSKEQVQQLCDELATLAAERFSDLTGTTWPAVGTALAQQLRALGHENLLKLFPTVGQNIDGQIEPVLDKRAHERALRGMGDHAPSRNLQIGMDPAGGVQKVEVVVRFADDGRLVGEVVENSPHQRRR